MECWTVVYLDSLKAELLEAKLANSMDARSVVMMDYLMVATKVVSLGLLQADSMATK